MTRAPSPHSRSPAPPLPSAAGPSGYLRIYATVARIPSGRVATYGQIAALAGIPGSARQVGYALHALPRGSVVPWHRVINARGEVSRRAVMGAEITQRLVLEAEGVAFDGRGRVPLGRFGWRPRARLAGVSGRGLR